MLALPRHWQDEKKLRETAMLALSAVGLDSLRMSARIACGTAGCVRRGRAPLMLRPAFMLLDEPAAGLSAEETGVGALVVEMAKERHACCSSSIMPISFSTSATA